MGNAYSCFTSAGVNALRFSFAGNGASGGQFTDATISKEVADLGSVLDAYAGWNVCYIGHSMGGHIAGLYSGIRPERVAIAGAVVVGFVALRVIGRRRHR